MLFLLNNDAKVHRNRDSRNIFRRFFPKTNLLLTQIKQAMRRREQQGYFLTFRFNISFAPKSTKKFFVGNNAKMSDFTTL